MTLYVLDTDHISLAQRKEAEASYRQTIQLDPDLAAVHSNLGAGLQDQGNLDEAEVSYRRAIQLDPDNSAAHDNLEALLRQREKE